MGYRPCPLLLGSQGLWGWGWGSGPICSCLGLLLMNLLDGMASPLLFSHCHSPSDLVSLFSYSEGCHERRWPEGTRQPRAGSTLGTLMWGHSPALSQLLGTMERGGWPREQPRSMCHAQPIMNRNQDLWPCRELQPLPLPSEALRECGTGC